MRLPRDVSGQALAQALGKVGYAIARQTGSHIRLTTAVRGGHKITVPAHDQLRVGTLASVLAEVARHLDLERDELLRRLFD
jgi:predicted RNA binding protein YcfA (HicA-like mRNA interferase family)